MRSSYVLARVAARLNRDQGGPAIPSLYFLTDPARVPDPFPTARRLPAGSAIIYRHFGDPARKQVARRLAALCRARGLKLLIAADPDLAAKVGAHGVHWPERFAPQPAPGLVSAAAHDEAAVARAATAGVHAVLLSPIFETASPSGRVPLGLFRASQAAKRASVPVIALGGISARNAARLIGRGFSGIAAVSGLA